MIRVDFFINKMIESIDYCLNMEQLSTIDEKCQN